jgi:hypothetical protein
MHFKIFKCKCVPKILGSTASQLSSLLPHISLSTKMWLRKPTYKILEDISLALKHFCHEDIHAGISNKTYHKTKFKKKHIIN